jgi:hypothetical protein
MLFICIQNQIYMTYKTETVNTMHQQQRMLKALAAHYGIVSRACKATGISRQTHYNWYSENEAYRERVDTLKFECHEEFKDIIMQAVIKKINEGNTTIIALCFKAICLKDAETMERLNPYKARIQAAIKVVPHPQGVNWANDPYTQRVVREMKERNEREEMERRRDLKL